MMLEADEANEMTKLTYVVIMLKINLVNTPSVYISA